MIGKHIFESANKIVSIISELKSIQGYSSDPYDLISEKYKMIAKIGLVEKPDLGKLTPLLNWSRLYSYRMVLEAPIKCSKWDELLNEIELFNSYS